MSRGLCRGVTNPDEIMKLCDTCPVKYRCLVEGTVYNEEGVWGGATKRERNRIPKQIKRDMAKGLWLLGELVCYSRKPNNDPDDTRGMSPNHKVVSRWIVEFEAEEAAKKKSPYPEVEPFVLEAVS